MRVVQAERVLRRAWRAGEASWRSLAAAGSAAAARREAAVLAHVKRRAAMCARRLGRLRDAARLFRELARDAPPALSSLSLHENLIEVLLEQKAYADVQVSVRLLEMIMVPASFTILCCVMSGSPRSLRRRVSVFAALRDRLLHGGTAEGSRCR